MLCAEMCTKSFNFRAASCSTQAPYRLIEALLLEQSARLGLSEAAKGEEDASLEALQRETPAGPLPFSSVFAIGDNPASGETTGWYNSSFCCYYRLVPWPNATHTVQPPCKGLQQADVSSNE